MKKFQEAIQAIARTRTQRAIAQEVGVTENTVALWLSGAGKTLRLTPKQYCGLLRLLRVSPAGLVKLVEESHE